MNTYLTHALTFVGGALAKWFQGQLQDRKKDQDSLRDDVFRPMRVEVHNAIPQIENRARVTTLDFGRWNRIVAEGRNRDILDDLAAALERLYNREMPQHDSAWQIANDEVARVMELADRNFGKSFSRRDLSLPPWYLFLMQENLKPEIVGWENGPPFRLWNQEVNPERLRPLHGSTDDSLKRIWEEGQKRQPIQDYLRVHASCLERSKECLGLLDAAIDESRVSRLRKPLGKLRF